MNEFKMWLGMRHHKCGYACCGEDNVCFLSNNVYALHREARMGPGAPS